MQLSRDMEFQQKIIEQFKKQQSDFIKAREKEITKWRKDLQKAVKSWRLGLLYRVNFRKAIALESIAEMEENAEEEGNGHKGADKQSTDEGDLLEYGNRAHNEAEANNDSGRKGHSKHEGTN